MYTTEGCRQQLHLEWNNVHNWLDHGRGIITHPKILYMSFFIHRLCSPFVALFQGSSAHEHSQLGECLVFFHISGGFRAARLSRQATCAVCALSLWVEKDPVPPTSRRALDWSVVLTVRRLCPIVPQDNIVVSNKHNWPEFYGGNAQACPGLEPLMFHMWAWHIYQMAKLEKNT